jgi:hypothetical protein
VIGERIMDEAQQGRVGFGRAYGGPGKYIQRPGEIDHLPAHLKSLGDSAFLLVDGFVLDSMGDALRESLAASGLPYEMERFHASVVRRKSHASRRSCALSRRRLSLESAVGKRRTQQRSPLVEQERGS